MKPAGQIDPELYDLLDEIVADPRSSLRLSPRKALAHWFDRGERLRPVDATVAERHLLEVHREALAELLIQASRIAYWQAPDMGIVARKADGSPSFSSLDPERLGQEISARFRAYPRSACPELAALIARRPERHQALALASAALALVPSDNARHAVAIATPWEQPVTALAVLSRLAERVREQEMLVCVLSAMGARLCSLHRLDEALSAYLRTRDLAEISAMQEYYILNLACYLDETEVSEIAAQRLRAAAWVQPFAGEQLMILKRFASSMGPSFVQKARVVSLRHAESSLAAKSVNEAMS